VKFNIEEVCSSVKSSTCCKWFWSVNRLCINYRIHSAVSWELLNKFPSCTNRGGKGSVVVVVSVLKLGAVFRWLVGFKFRPPYAQGLWLVQLSYWRLVGPSSPQVGSSRDRERCWFL